MKCGPRMGEISGDGRTDTPPPSLGRIFGNSPFLGSIYKTFEAFFFFKSIQNLSLPKWNSIEQSIDNVFFRVVFVYCSAMFMDCKI